LARGAWEAARSGFEAVLSTAELPEAFEGLGMAAWWLDDPATVIAARERAFRLYRDRGDRRSAGRVATDLAFDHAVFRLELAISNGWMQRAHRLLADLPPCPEQVWTAVLEAILCFHLEGDMERVLREAQRGADIASRLGRIPLEMLTLSCEGLALVGLGRVAEGTRRLDEAAIAAVSGEIDDARVNAAILCAMIWACEFARDIDRVMQWCEKFTSYCETRDLRPYLNYCRCHYASVLAAHGRWQDAERLLLDSRTGLRNWPAWSLTVLERLGELRRRQGRLDDAVACFDAAPHHLPSLLGKARVALDRGDTSLALDLTETVLRRLPVHATGARIPALEALVQIHCARGDIHDATAALRDLEDAAGRFPSAWMAALVHDARGRVALCDGAPGNAKVHFEDAFSLYDRNALPYEAAQAQVGIAHALVALGRREQGQEQASVARATLQGLGVTSARADDRTMALPAAVGIASLSRREAEVLRLLSRGLSNQQIADELFLSRHTVRRHVSSILGKLEVSSRTAAVVYAAEHDLR
jgi:ATP/maltotriose-dependent transcriptional regulator MalT